jgi:hypothetical protein
VVPLFAKAPVIDGQVAESEWARAAEFTGFQWQGKLAQRRVRGYVGATETHLYVAIVSQLPDKGQLVAQLDRDSLKVVHDDSVEVYVCPTPEQDRRVDYQLLVNSKGFGGYNIHQVGGDSENVAWKGDWQQKSGMHDGEWHFECAIPIASMVKNRAGTDGEWRINLTRNWKNPWTWSSLAGAYAQGGLRFRFVSDGAPTVAYRVSSDPFLAGFTGQLSLINPGTTPLPLRASMVLERNRMPAIRAEKELTLAPGAKQTVDLPVPKDDPTTKYTLQIAVASPDGKTTYYTRTVSWPKGKPYVWLAGEKKKALPIDFRFAYYPYTNIMRLAVDINGMPKDAKVKGIKALVRDRDTGETVKTVDIPVAGFADGKQDLRFELPPLKGFYEIVVRADAPGLENAETVQRFERRSYPWEHTPTGRSTKVYPPFTPIEVKDSTLKTVLRTHTLGELGLPAQIVAKSAQTGIAKPLLAAPIRLEGASVTGRLDIAEAKPNTVRTTSALVVGVAKGRLDITWDYDGTAKVELTLDPSGGKPLDKLDLVIPLRTDAATMMHANADRIRAPVAQYVPEGKGVVWTADKLACDDFIPNFCPYIFVGTPVRGICWFADNDLGWGWNPKTSNLDVYRDGDQVQLRVHLINQPTVIEKPRTITFGLLAAPVKPRLSPGGPNGWRYRYARDRYTMLGTDINWLSIGTCGSVYPAGRDMYLWEMLKRGNEQQLDGATIKRVSDWGERYFVPYGKGRVNTWRRHVNYNLRSRYDQRMVFYYNRASHQGCEEFETFKDEWCLDDLRSVPKGNGLGEIKIVPTESYIDFCLYWYARSFEIGGNQGVYWDNWFIAPSFNTETTTAYRRPDGSIAPSAGMWALRELARRTFVMENERGMRPITFPHMTSFNPLPMMSFATVQYDWEWKYSLGDVQDRHTRELLLMTSTGELSGVWPVPLSDQGKLAKDPWTQRTFTAVRLVHELDGYGGTTAWVKELAPNRKLMAAVLERLDDPALKAVRYWDDGPHPVRTNDPDLLPIVYYRPGTDALIAIVSYAKDDRDASITIDLKALGLPANAVAKDVENGDDVPLADGKITVPIKKHDIRMLTIRPPL